MAKRKRGAKGRPLGHRSNGRGSLVMDVTVAGIPIRRATGTTDPRQYQLYRGMVEQLGAAGRLDILRQLADRTVTFAEVWDVVRPQTDRPVNLNRLPSPETMRTLFGPDGAMTRWAAHTPVADSTDRARQRDLTNLSRVAGPFQTVNDLPGVLLRWKAVCEERGTARTYNMARVTALAFARATLGRSHPIYGALIETPTMAESSKAGKPLEPDALRDYLTVLRDRMPAHYAEEFRSLCVTGMRPIEYWGEAWTVNADHIAIVTAKPTGTNRSSRIRLVPRVTDVFVPPGTWGTWQNETQRKGLHRLHTAYDGRRTFAHACEESGIPDSRMRYYLGHGIQRVTDRYTRHEVRPHLASDAAKLRAWFGFPAPSVGLQLVEEA